MRKQLTTDDAAMLKAFAPAESPEKVSPLKKQMRAFESAGSPGKRVGDLEHEAVPVKESATQAAVEPFASLDINSATRDLLGGMSSSTSASSSRSLLKTRKKQAPRLLNFDEVAEVSQEIVSFGKYISGKNLGYPLTLRNKTTRDQQFTVGIDESTVHYAESMRQIFGKYLDLPFKVPSSDDRMALNSERKFKCWFVENPLTSSMQKSFVLRVPAQQERKLIVILRSPMDASCADMMAKLLVTLVPEEGQQTFYERRIGN